MKIIKKNLKVFIDDKRIKFLIVGGLNTLVSFVLYSALVFVEIYPPVAMFLVYPIGIIQSYMLNKYFTFKSRGKSLKELARFVLITLCAMVINIGSLSLFVNILELDALLSGLLSLFFATVISYLGHNKFSFRQKV